MPEQILATPVSSATTTPPGRADRSRAFAGVATRDITPSGHVTMSGYAARTERSNGVHDRLSVRALVVGRTAVVTVDVVGLHEDFCARVRRSCAPVVDHVVVHATHTHGGPASVPGRLGGGVNDSWIDQVHAACVAAVGQAAQEHEEVTIGAGYGPDPGVSHNRRRPDGPVDTALPSVRFERNDGSTLALLVSYACHPVVLGPDNLELTADYPGVARSRLEELTGGTALFATSCAGDLNTGHAVGDPSATTRPELRTFGQCDRIGSRIASSALRTDFRDGDAEVQSLSATVDLTIQSPSRDELDDLDRQATAEIESRDASVSAIFELWRQWVADTEPDVRSSWHARVNVLLWGPALIITFPGEPFCSASLLLRRRLAQTGSTVLVLGYSDGSPGYLPSADEYPAGGYEVCEAHRYYGMPGSFVPGSLETLVESALELTQELAHEHASTDIA